MIPPPPSDATFTLQKQTEGVWEEVGSTTYGEFKNGSYTFTNLDAGTYRVAESNATVDGYKLTTSNSQTVTLTTSDGAISISNDYKYVPKHTEGSITVSKNTTGDTNTPDTATFTLQKQTESGWEDVGSATYDDFVNGSYTFDDLDAGTYQVVESNAAVSGYKLNVTNEGKAILETTTADNGDTDVSDGAIYITNDYEYIPVHTKGSLTVSKSTTGDAATPDSATFTLQKQTDDGVETVGTVTYSQLKDGSYTFTDLDEGTYSVTESGAEVTGYKLSVDNSGAVVLKKVPVGDKGDTVIEGGTITVTNNYEYIPVHTKGSVVVSKSTTGDAATPDTAVFTLQKQTDDGVETVGTVTYSQLKDGSYTFTDLDEGTYSVTESGAEVTGYKLSVDNSGAVVLSKTSVGDKGDTDVSDGAILIVNTYSIPYQPVHTKGTITVTKQSNGAVTPDTATFTLQKQTESGWDNVGSAAYSQFVNGSYTFAALDEGAYRVVESDAGVDGYKWSYTNSGAAELVVNTAENGDTDVSDGTITVTNNYEYIPVHTKGSVVVTKSTSGVTDTPSGAKFQLQQQNETGGWTNVGSAVSYGAFVDGKYIFDELDEGTYRVVESNARVVGCELTTHNDGAVILTTNTAENGDTDVNDGAILISNIYSLPYQPVHTKGTITVTKQSIGAATPDDAEFKLQKRDRSGWDTVDTVTYSEFVGGKYTFTELMAGTYRVVESGADVADYTLDTTNSGNVILVTSTEDDGDTNVSDSAVVITNTYTGIVDPTPPTPPTSPTPPTPPTPPAPPVEEELPDEDIPLEELPDEDIPTVDVPKTDSSMTLWLLTAMASGLGLVTLALTGKKRKENA